MKKGCLSVKNRTRSEEISEVVSNEESHHKRRSFDGKAIRQLPDQDDKNTLFCRTHLFRKYWNSNILPSGSKVKK